MPIDISTEATTGSMIETAEQQEAVPKAPSPEIEGRHRDRGDMSAGAAAARRMIHEQFEILLAHVLLHSAQLPPRAAVPLRR